MTITEKVAYLKGLMEGLEFAADTKEAKIIKMMAEILEDMALEIVEAQDGIDDINEYLEAMDEDLTNVEEEIFGEFDEDFEDCDCGCEDCDCDDCDCDDCDDCDCFEILCPSCKKVICLEECPEGDKILCPVCGAEIPLQ